MRSSVRNVYLAGLVLGIAMCVLIFAVVRTHPPEAHHQDWGVVRGPRSATPWPRLGGGGGSTDAL